MHKKQTNAVAQRTQKAISEAFLILIKERAYEDITVTEICARADVVRKTFYNNFQSKDDVVICLINGFATEMESGMDLQKMSVRNMLLTAFKAVMDNREMLLLFYERDLFRFARKILPACITREHMLIRFDKDKTDLRAYKYISAQASAVLISVIETWIENGLQEPVEFLAELTETLLYRPYSDKAEDAGMTEDAEPAQKGV